MFHFKLHKIMKNFYRRGMLIIMFLLAMAFLVLFAMGQAKATTLSPPIYFEQQEISGSVTNTSGEPLMGVTVLIKNRQYGTTTNANGTYSINATPRDTLVISFIGYKTQEIALKGRPNVDIILEEDIAALNEVEINAGYYNITERERTGNISRVTAEEIENQPVSNPLAAMQGRMPGVNITQTTGVPGGGFDIKIRGRNSIRAIGNEPLYIVDGVPFSSGSLGSSRNSASIIPINSISPLNLINAADIKSIEILKDADATAIYGSRGANGVVLINTKRGVSSKTALEVKAYSGVGKITRSIDLMNTAQYLEMRKEAYANDGVNQLPARAYDVNGIWDQNRYTDWQEELIGGSAEYNDIRLAFSGGNEQTRFLLNGNYRNETTVYPGDYDYNKTAVLLNVNHTSKNRRFTMNTSVNYVLDNNNLPATDLTREALRLPPNAPELYNEDGSLNWASSTWNNPLRYLETKYRSNSNNLIANASIQYRLATGWNAKINLGYSNLTTVEDRTTPSTFYNPAFGLGSAFSFINVNDGNRNSWIIEPQISWEKELGNNAFKLLAGTTFQTDQSSQVLQFAQGFTTNRLIYNLAAANDIFVQNDEESVYRYNAIFGRLNYKYKDRYIINLTGRRDGSSRFGPGNKLANFWALGTAWIFSDEPALNNISALSFGKLRGSYGITGNDQIGNYQYLDTYTVSGNQYDGVNTLSPSRLFNPNFGWEENKKFEAGIDLGFFDEDLIISTSFYRNISSNQLVGIPLPGTTGFSSIQANLDATVKNTGWEFETVISPITTDTFSWRFNANLTFSRNELVRFPGLEASTYANQYVIGKPLTINKFFEYTGIDSDTGIYTFRDFNNDGVIASPDDNQYIADATPDFYGGVSNIFNYKNFDFSFHLQFAKQQGYNYLFFTGLPGTMSNKPVDLLDRWQKPGDEALIQRYSAGYNSEASRAQQRFSSSSAAFSDASYLRLKNLSVGYTVPEKALGVGTLRVYFQAQNLLTFTSYKGMDPETLNMQSLPPLRILTAGFQFNL